MQDTAPPQNKSISENSGTIDSEYLATALDRAGLPAPQGVFETEELLGGRTGATVTRLITGERSFVLKLVQEGSWRIEGLGLREGGEHRLWLHGLTRDIPGAIECPVIDVSAAPQQGLFYVLMEDVGLGIRDRGKFTLADSRALIRALAEMQAAYYQSDALDIAALPYVTGFTRMLSAPVLHLSGKRKIDEPWLPSMLEDFQVVSVFLPLFLEVLGPRLADAYLVLVDDSSWVNRLEELPVTLLHGDLRRANIAFDNGRIPIVDWEFASKGPPGCDLQWHCFLHFWGYPPDGVAPGSDCDDLRDEYLAALESALGYSVDHEAYLEGWKLGWLKVMAQLGYTLIDPLYPDGGNPEQRSRIEALSTRAVQRALDFRESLG